MNRDILEKEFEPSQIKRRRGYFGDDLDYVETADVIKRLNAAFDGEWSFEQKGREEVYENGSEPEQGSFDRQPDP